MEELIEDGKKETHTPANKGGLKTLPFIMANEIFEKVASQGLLANMIIYLKSEYHTTSATGTNIIFLWSALSNFVPIFGAFLSDSYLGRFRVIALGSTISLIGMLLLWITAVLPSAHPTHCDDIINKCNGATLSQYFLLFSSFALISIGAGGIRPCSLTFGADQLQNKNDPKNERKLQSFFNFYYASVGFSIIIAVTVIVYIQDHKGFNIGFGIPVILMTLSASLFLLGSRYYKKVKANKSTLAGLIQVIVVSIKNRHLALPPKDADGWYHYKKGFGLSVPSDKLRFLNKACIIRNPPTAPIENVSTTDPWTLCTVQQVEDLKHVLRVLPIWSTGIMPAVVISQHSFPVLQASLMNRHLTSSFQIPAGSFVVFSIITLTFWVTIYDRLIVPPLSNFTGRPRGLSLQQRMGLGLGLSIIATATAAAVEDKRRTAAVGEGIHVSAMWLILQHCFTGLSEAFNIIGQIEFYYSEFPKSMASVGISLFALGLGVGNLVGSVIVSTVVKVTGRNGGRNWLSDDLNQGRYDCYYWLLTFMSGLNLVYYLVCSWMYGEEGKNTGYEEEVEGDDGDYGGCNDGEGILLKSPQLLSVM